MELDVYVFIYMLHSTSLLFISCTRLLACFDLKLPATKPFAAAIWCKVVSHVEPPFPDNAHHIELRSGDIKGASKIIYVSINDGLLNKQIWMSIVDVPIFVRSDSS